MKLLKNSLVGFLVSFVGSIPLGYLNVIGFDIYCDSGIQPTVLYLFGVIAIEYLVIFATLIFANSWNNNTKLLQFIEAFSVVFMFVLAYVFYSTASSEQNHKMVFSIIGQSFFLTGLLYSSLNFIQIPFWLSWNLYLLNGNFIEISKTKKYFYVFGTVVGTFFGMLTLILSLYYFASNVDFISKYLMQIIIPLVFIGLGLFQAFTFWKKYFFKSKVKKS